MTAVTETVRARRGTGTVLAALLVAALLGLGVALTAVRIGLAVQPGPDLGAVADLVYPGLAVTTTADPFTVIHRHPTASTIAVAAVAGLASAVLAWWLCAGGRRRMRTIGPGARTAVRETAVIGLVLTLPALAQTALILSGRTTADFHPPQWAELLVQYARWPAALGLLLLLGAAAGLMAAEPDRGQPSG